mgnify:CR=1 FL=1
MSTRQERRRQERLAKKQPKDQLEYRNWADGKGKEKIYNMEVQLIQPWSVPVFKTTLPPEILQTMTEISDKVLADKNAVDWGANLAGQICSEPLIDHNILNGTIKYLGNDLLKMSTEERASAGVFLAFQYPVEIPGVATSTFVRTALNAQRRNRGEDELDAMEFLKLARQKAKELEMSEDFFQRAVNVGFSGGEKKRAEVFQMSMLAPTLAILDETDSGLDIDALKIIAKGVNSSRNDKKSFLVITHYQRLLDHIKPDFVHVLSDGKIIKTGCGELAEELEKTGYKKLN